MAFRSRRHRVPRQPAVANAVHRHSAVTQGWPQGQVGLAGGGVGNQGHLVDVAQRVAKVRYGIKSDGKIKVESKDEMKKRGLPSPDVVDAFVLTFAEVGRGRQKVRRTRQASWRVT